MIKLLVLSRFNSPKLNYVLDFLCTEFLMCPYEITESKEYFINHSSIIKISYLEHHLEGILSIPCFSYFENFNIENVPDFEMGFTCELQRCNFDIFGAVFYLLARVEEYGRFEKDEHGRFSSDKSILSKKGLIDIPIVDGWCMALRNIIENQYKVSLNDIRKTQHLSTIDVDHIFAYRSKLFITKLGSLIKDLVQFNLQRLKDRFLEDDPYDVFDYLCELHDKANLKFTSFVLTTQKGRYDRSLSPKHKDFKNRIQILANDNEVGIHPSYSSNYNTDKIKSEKSELEEVIATKVVKSRQHYIRLKFPNTYRALLKSGIEEDYSMGYPDRSGFRAGTCRSFYWYDLQSDTVTDLKVIPFQLMDVTLRKYENLSPSQAISKARLIFDNANSAGGNVSVIWHNSSFYNAEGWEGWEEVYEEIINLAAQ